MLDWDADRLSDIIDLAADWVWETDAEHRYTFVSPRLIEHTGLPLEHWLNTTRLETLALAHDREVVEAHIKDILAHRPFRNLVYWIDRPTGLHCFETSGKPKFDANGKLWGIAVQAATLPRRKGRRPTWKRPRRIYCGRSAWRHWASLSPRWVTN